jgi:hypothetical protein
LDPTATRKKQLSGNDADHGVLCSSAEEKEAYFQASQNMIRDPDLDPPRLPGKKDKRVHHDWRRPSDAAINKLEWQLETARDQLVKDLHHTNRRLGCSHYFDAPDDPLSIVFSAFDDKIEQALCAFRRAIR